MKDNLILITALPFLENNLVTFRPIIEKTITIPSTGKIVATKNNKWSTLIVHRIPLKAYPDNTIGMKELKRETLNQNHWKDTGIAQTLKYLSNPENRNGKTHSLIVLCLRGKEEEGNI